MAFFWKAEYLNGISGPVQMCRIMWYPPVLHITSTFRQV